VVYTVYIAYSVHVFGWSADVVLVTFFSVHHLFILCVHISIIWCLCPGMVTKHTLTPPDCFSRVTWKKCIHLHWSESDPLLFIFFFTPISFHSLSLLYCCFNTYLTVRSLCLSFSVWCLQVPLRHEDDSESPSVVCLAVGSKVCWFCLSFIFLLSQPYFSILQLQCSLWPVWWECRQEDSSEFQ